MTVVTKYDPSAVCRAIELVDGQRNLSERLTASGNKVSQPAISNWVKGKAKPKLEFAMAIESITRGEVKAHEVRPDLASLFPTTIT